jgi:hypothetical protein
MLLAERGSFPQGLKPWILRVSDGMAEAVPFSKLHLCNQFQSPFFVSLKQNGNDIAD